MVAGEGGAGSSRRGGRAAWQCPPQDRARWGQCVWSPSKPRRAALTTPHCSAHLALHVMGLDTLLPASRSFTKVKSQVVKSACAWVGGGGG